MLPTLVIWRTLLREELKQAAEERQREAEEWQQQQQQPQEGAGANSAAAPEPDAELLGRCHWQFRLLCQPLLEAAGVVSWVVVVGGAALLAYVAAVVTQSLAGDVA